MVVDCIKPMDLSLFALSEVYAQPSTEEQGRDTEWVKLRNELTPQLYPVWLMWTPHGGRFEEG